jgi:hypothetical protein
MAAAASTVLNVLLIITLSNVSSGGSSASMIEGIVIGSNTYVISLTNTNKARSLAVTGASKRLTV